MTASLEQLPTGSQRATRRVNQLRALARAENLDHANAYASAAFDLNELAESCTLEWVETAIARDIDLGFDPAEVPLPVFGSRIMINELLNNLIENALLYTQPGGRVTVRAGLRDEQVLLHIVDSGPGIPEDLQARVFDRFFRVLGNEDEGSGLGLALVKEVADHHLASIEFQTGRANV